MYIISEAVNPIAAKSKSISSTMAAASQIKKPQMDKKEFERVARHIAAQMGDEQLVDDINMEGQYAMYIAASNGLLPMPLANDKRFPNTN